MTTILQLPVPGPDSSKTYTVHAPSPIPGHSVSEPGDIVTVSVIRSRSSASHTISFILSAKQALPWLDFLASNICPTTTAMLYDSEGLVAQVTLKSLTRPVQSTAESLRKQADTTREEGNNIFKHSENDFLSYKSAILQYAKAADCYRLGVQEPSFLAKMYSNIALALLRTCENTAALSHADVADSLAKHDAKVVYRRALAYIEFDHPVRALAELKHAAAICPQDRLIEHTRSRISSQLLELLAKRRQHFAEVYNVLLRSPIFKRPLVET